MRLSRIAGYGASGLVFQWGSSIKLPWVCTVTCQYNSPLQPPTGLSHNHETQFHTSPDHYMLVVMPLLQICSLCRKSGTNHQRIVPISHILSMILVPPSSECTAIFYFNLNFNYRIRLAKCQDLKLNKWLFSCLSSHGSNNLLCVYSLNIDPFK